MTREQQYAGFVDQTRVLLGPMTSDSWRRDPKHLLFTLARYKFVAQMLAGTARVIEVGCGDAHGARLVRQTCGYVLATDFDERFVSDAQLGQASEFAVDVAAWDPLLDGVHRALWDAAYLLDVLEHVRPADERYFLQNITRSVRPGGVMIVGSPSRASQEHASSISRAGHVNCKTSAELSELLRSYFAHVFMFGMNDEMLHTGFSELRHYLLALCVGRL